MANGGRWFRVNTTWSQSEWIDALEPAARLAWIELLSYVKAHGYDGKVRAVSPVVFARMYRIPVADVAAMIEAALKDGALSLSDLGDWVIAKWQEHQGDTTARSRMQRYRQSVTPVTEVTRNDRSVTPTETETETIVKKTPSESKKKTYRQKLDEWTPTPEHIILAHSLGLVAADVEAQASQFLDYALNRKDPYKDLDAAFRNWLRNARSFSRGGNGLGGEQVGISLPEGY